MSAPEPIEDYPMAKNLGLLVLEQSVGEFGHKEALAWLRGDLLDFLAVLEIGYIAESPEDRDGFRYMAYDLWCCVDECARVLGPREELIPSQAPVLPAKIADDQTGENNRFPNETWLARIVACRSLNNDTQGTAAAERGFEKLGRLLVKRLDCGASKRDEERAGHPRVDGVIS